MDEKKMPVVNINEAKHTCEYHCNKCMAWGRKTIGQKSTRLRKDSQFVDIIWELGMLIVLQGTLLGIIPPHNGCVRGLEPCIPTDTSKRFLR